ncbi:MAG: sigma-70 family RNA polymerase sigma factor [Acidobacteriia bacterium]|nr:sigma-70 family RNA polymerase sigma factor [Terriglobia bacterium]
MTAAAAFFSALMAPDTQAVARGLRRRDPELLDGLIEQYQYRLYRYLLYLTGSAEAAEDLFQETWIRVLERGHQYDGQSKFETWLFAIARHLTIDLARRKRPDGMNMLSEEPAAAGVSAFDQVSSQETKAQIQARLGQVPAVYREVLLLRFQEEITLEEIGAVLGTPLSTVKSRLYRGLDALRALFAEEPR